MDYLGIGISPPVSETGEPSTDVRGDTEQNVTTQVGTRTWSKPSMSETGLSQSFSRPRGAQSPIISGRGIVVCLETTRLSL